MKLKTLTLVFLYFLSLSSLLGQQILEGQIQDSNGASVAFAHIFFLNQQSGGATSNELGQFKLNISKENHSDSLVISALGYKTLTIAYTDLDLSNASFTIKSSSVLLNEIEIISDTYLRYLLKEAIKNIPNNYPNSKHYQKAYYQNYTISDTVYSEMIEADILSINHGYGKSKYKNDVYLRELRKTEDNRNLPNRLRSDRNAIMHTIGQNPLFMRTFSRFGKWKSLTEFESEIDKIENISVVQEYTLGNDTIMTLKVDDPFFRLSKNDELLIYSLISINKTDKAIVKCLYGDKWSKKDDFTEIEFRKINGLYYPAYIRYVFDIQYNKETNSHYTSHTILFYDTFEADKFLEKNNKGKKLKIDNNIRSYKTSDDASFWDNYTVSYQLPATSILRSKTNKAKHP